MNLHSKIFKTEQKAFEYADKNLFHSQYSGVKETIMGNFRIILLK